MRKQAKLSRQVTLTAGAVPRCLELVAKLRFYVPLGGPVVDLLDELANALLDVEGLVGVQTPQGLFAEPVSPSYCVICGTNNCVCLEGGTP